ncbi:MAG: TylF/MycF family methyltransferase [Planctomycetia bacterium]|nr:TylF/MycF family methyltransferase [Planctomycetia bacterium]
MSFSVTRLAERTYRSLQKRLAPAGGLTAARLRMPDVAEADFAIMEQVTPYTMIGADRLLALIDATRYVARAGIEGAMVECGVWRGGASMAAMLTMMEAGHRDREFYLYDTYEGMSQPTEHDRRIDGRHALPEFHQRKTAADTSDWCRAGLDEVRRAVHTTGYPPELIRFVAGKVEDTIPNEAPEKIAVLRLDTDWYVSTKHEMDHLFPRLARGGVLIVDDYGHWQGARQAVDEYFEHHGIALLLSRTDYTGRMGVKI